VGTSSAYPAPPTPTPKSQPSDTPVPAGNVLPLDSTLIFVLDDPISSKGAPKGQIVRAHLKSDLVVGGHTLAPAGTPAQIRIVDNAPADIGDVYGFVDIFFEPLALPDGRSLPIHAPAGRLEPHVSGGHESTVEAEDTVGDIFVPYYGFYQIFRKGKNFVLPAGSDIPARTEATITAQPNGSIAIVTPRPMPHMTDVPAATFPVEPVATPIGSDLAPPHSRPLQTPSISPSLAPSPSPSPAQSPPALL